MSGTPISYFAFHDFNNHTDFVKQIAEKNGVEIHGENELIDFLTNISVDEILKHPPPIHPGKRTLTVPWAPSIESLCKHLNKKIC